MPSIRMNAMKATTPPTIESTQPIWMPTNRAKQICLDGIQRILLIVWESV